MKKINQTLDNIRFLGSYFMYLWNKWNMYVEDTFKDQSFFCYISIGTEVHLHRIFFYNIGLVYQLVYPVSHKVHERRLWSNDLPIMSDPIIPIIY
jgi:hypothetical protein